MHLKIWGIQNRNISARPSALGKSARNFNEIDVGEVLDYLFLMLEGLNNNFSQLKKNFFFFWSIYSGLNPVNLRNKGNPALNYWQAHKKFTGTSFILPLFP